MAYNVVHKNSTVAGTPPTASEIELGEIGINAADAELYLKDTSGNIKKIANTDTTGTAAGIQFVPSGTGAVQRTVESKLQDVVSVKDFGAVGNNIADDTAAIQAALDEESYAPVFFPPGAYKITDTLTLSKERMLLGSGRASRLMGGSIPSTNVLLNVAITSTKAGFTDSRNFAIRDLYMLSGGSHCLYFAPVNSAFSILTAAIDNCTFSAADATKYSIFINDNVAHSNFRNCTANRIYAKCLDANVFDGCTIFGTGIGIEFNLTAYGVRNNTVQNCTIVNRDGAVKITRGDNVRIINNQFEVALGYTPSENQSTPSTMVYVGGNASYPSVNTVIENNNFGGGTNVDNLIYLNYAYNTIIRGNNMIASDVVDIYATSTSKSNYFYPDNLVQGTPSDPRTRTVFKEEATDLGTGNMGFKQAGTKIIAQGTWTRPDFFYKDCNGYVHFLATFDGGSTVAGSLMGQLQTGHQPESEIYLTAATDAGAGVVRITDTGAIYVVDLPSNSKVKIESFLADNIQVYNKFE